MSARGMLTVVGTAVGGIIGWSDDEVPSADPASVRALFADLGVRVGATAADLEAVLRRFQAWVGLPADGIAGPRTVHHLARYAREARELRVLEPHAA
jgi:murein L,D-transpeptidase YcbB/YkuD